MKLFLPYGREARLTLELKPHTLIADCVVRGEPLADVLAATRRALLEPLDLPALARCVVPGDKVAVALDAGVPQSDKVLAAVIGQLQSAGVEPADITVVIAPDDALAAGVDPRTALPPEIRALVALEKHDPANKGQLSFFAADAADQPIYINRTLLDADMVVPIGNFRAANSLGHHGPTALIFPALADDKTIMRHRDKNLKLASRAGEDAANKPGDKLQTESEELTQLMGVLFTLQVIGGQGEEVLHILAGDPRSVRRRCEELSQQAWEFSPESQAKLVIATIEGAASRQTWDHLARACVMARRAVVNEGAIVICSELAEPLGLALQRIAGQELSSESLRKVRKEVAPDALVATELLLTQERAKLYLLSQLPEETIEELGITHIAKPDDISRLAKRQGSVILLRNADRMLVT